jgi:hypothetical protein
LARECLALVADTSISGIRVARELDKIVAMRGRPGGIISDNGTASTAILAVASDAKKHIQSPTDSASLWLKLGAHVNTN